ncbi:MAG: sugar ABC transporter substrate-binding protein [Caldilineaceae bacterium]|nr:sugar ABC transporter substrate-binding protein [Caldilineaceae bacterium]
MSKNRLWMVVTLAVLLAMLVSACAVPPPPPAAPAADTGSEAAAEGGAATEGTTEDGTTTLTWAMWGSPAEIVTHQAVADAFMAEHPEIKIEITSEPWGDYFTKMQTLWASGDANQIPDVLFLTPVLPYAAQGVLENLDPYIEQAGYDLEDYWPSLLDPATYEGSVYGFPRDSGLEVLYYNKDIFDEVGIDYPTDDWTWDDLRAAAEALTVRDGDQVTRYGLAMEGGKYQLWVGQNHGAIFDDLNNPSACTLDSPEAIEAVEFFSGMMNDGIAMRDANLSQAGGDAAVFASGQAAMIIQNASRVSQFNQADLNYDVATVPLPEGGQRSASAVGAAWTMSAASDNKDAAWTFLSWLQSTDGGQRIYTQSGEILPALQSTAKSDAFLGTDQPPANRQAFITEGEGAKPGRIALIPEWNEINGSIISPALEQIWVGDATPAEALPALCDQVDAFLADNGYPK